ncbi:MAG TPA: YihY/virulence factor BrkB family protein [Gemmatimonadales bacterium]
MPNFLRELVVTTTQFFTLLRKAASAWNDDDASSMGAALSYYTLFSIAPLLVIVIAVGGLIFGRDATQGQILIQLRGLIGDAGARAAQDLLQSANSPAKSAMAAIVGSITLLLGASSVFTELYGDLNKIWRIPSAPKTSGIVQLIRTRILSFGMIIGVGFLLVVSLVISAALAAAGAWWGARVTDWPSVVQAINAIVSLAIITLAFAMIYKVLPRADIAWRDVWIGALVTALLFEIGKLLIGIYLGTTRIASAFGATGSLVVFLVWVYYSAQIFLLGAEFTWVYAYRQGSRASEEPPAPAPRRAGRPIKRVARHTRTRVAPRA